MKKLLVFVLCFVLIFAFAGCGNNDSLMNEINSLKDEIATLKEQQESKLPDFKDCEIGYELDIYPKVAFDYKVSEDCIVHIESIAATLTAKNVIEEGNVLEGDFYKYSITITAFGSVSPIPQQKTYLYIVFGDIVIGNLAITPSVSGIIDDNGNFNLSAQVGLNNNVFLNFMSCVVV